MSRNSGWWKHQKPNLSGAGNSLIKHGRVEALNDRDLRKGDYVLYWMQQSQRAEWNHALEYAVRQANALGLPVVVMFGITDEFPQANLRHYTFMLEGLRETRSTLAKRGIQMVVRHESPEKAAVAMARRAALVVTDRGYLRIQKAWRRHVAHNTKCRAIQVESDVVVPVQVASDKEEYAARTIRPKIHRHLPDYLVPLRHRTPSHESLRLKLPGFDLSDLNTALDKLKIDRRVQPSPVFRGGTSEAKKLLRRFIRKGLADYADRSNDPSAGCVSHLSPYLHFGQISPLYVALKIINGGGALKSVDAFLEQLIVRRELSMNFANFCPRYDSFACIPDWALRTLMRHRDDAREYTYSLAQWERAETHDPYWNAAQREMVSSGKMHNYMRMYWGKKILEWSATPRGAFRTALYLNNKYELDGRDPNGFAGVAWCFGKHDRAWSERPVLGTVRYMNAAGLERKFDMAAYLRHVSAIEDAGNGQD
jgi:deoxyribodipyrimidine photo-lyase